MVKAVLRHKPPVHMANVVRQEDKWAKCCCVKTIWYRWNTTEPFSKAIYTST